MKALKFIMLGVVVVSLLAAGQVSAQAIKESLFAEADKAFEAAGVARADILAPKNYGKAMEHYREAEKRLDRGKDLEGIRSELKKSLAYLGKAMEATELAKVTFATTLQARANAVKAEAPVHSTAVWGKAEEKFAEATRKLEGGSVNDGRKNGSAAESLYRDAELDAIKNYMFDEARASIRQAVEQKADKYAPKTLARARELLAGAESSLEKNRYDTDKPRMTTREASYEARHAAYIAEMVSAVERGDRSVEEFLLTSEMPLVKIAGTMDIVPRFDMGYDATTTAIIAKIDQAQSDAEHLRAEVSDRDEHIRQIEEQVALLEKKLGGASQEQLILKERVQEQEEARKRVAKIETMFQPGEAKVVREGSDIIIRLTGMNFQSGKADISPEYFGLLARVQEAVATYGSCKVRIEGHTDSYGTDDANLTLSQKRAAAVEQYLKANMRVNTSISAVGFGETRPIANNETEEGRMKNRRIDIVVSPTASSG